MEPTNEIQTAPGADFADRLEGAFEAALARPQRICLRRDEAIFTRGQQDTRIYLVVSGIVKLVHVSMDGKIGVAAVRGRGEVFGELTVGGAVVRDHSAVALSPASVLAAPAESVLREVGARGLMAGFVARLSARVLDQQDFITSLLTVDCEHRLARILLEIAAKGAERDEGGRPITVPLLQTELAEMVGTSRSRIGGFLKRFGELGWIRVDRDGRIAIDVRNLGQFAGGAESVESHTYAAGSDNARAMPSQHAPTVRSRIQVRAGTRAREVPASRSDDVSLASLAMPSVGYSLQTLDRRTTRTALRKPSRPKR